MGDLDAEGVWVQSVIETAEASMLSFFYPGQWQTQRYGRDCKMRINSPGLSQ